MRQPRARATLGDGSPTGTGYLRNLNTRWKLRGLAPPGGRGPKAKPSYPKVHRGRVRRGGTPRSRPYTKGGDAKGSSPLFPIGNRDVRADSPAGPPEEGALTADPFINAAAPWGGGRGTQGGGTFLATGYGGSTKGVYSVN